MVAPQFIIAHDIIRNHRSQEGGLTQQFFFDASNGEEIDWDTYQIIQRFGIPEGKVIELDGISFWTNTGSVSMQVQVDPKLKQPGPPQPEAGDGSDPVSGMVQPASKESDRLYFQRMFGMRCIDELRMKFFGIAQWHTSWHYRLAPGDMRTIDDDGLRVGDIRQVTPDRTPGEPLFQLGPITQIGSPGEDIP